MPLADQLEMGCSSFSCCCNVFAQRRCLSLRYSLLVLIEDRLSKSAPVVIAKQPLPDSATRCATQFGKWRLTRTLSSSNISACPHLLHPSPPSRMVAPYAAGYSAAARDFGADDPLAGHQCDRAPQRRDQAARRSRLHLSQRGGNRQLVGAILLNEPCRGPAA